MKDNAGKKLAWFIVGSCSVASVMLLGGAVVLPSLLGIYQIQKDIGLYFILSGVSVLSIIVFLAAVAVSLSVKDRAKGLSGVLQWNHGICIVAFVNGLIPLLILCVLAPTLWKH